ncbi:hypothetical protein KYG_03676 [Acidovorax sp. NO-1]|uniref:IPTL-CTERM sorting domain-containing protein n=1 Tax=Acidovorax sp. NO-1 TaxID=512030 RepID=UPI00023FCB23|nr:IPTL-CTERM sorting domain-containing protein [Acidovorax sp. NO-1]EHL24308.1 hypothetical protein KYG_03676 [Acidovorax sp. NO-1]
MSITFGESLWCCAVRRIQRVLGVASLGTAILAHGAPVTTVVVEESFVYTGGISLVGQSGGTGWTSAWVSDSPAFTDFFTNATGLALPGVTASGGRAVFRAAGTQINDAARSLPLQNTGVVFIQFLSQFGTQFGGGTPTIRLSSSGVQTGGVGNNGGCVIAVYAILTSNLAAASCSAVSLGTLSAVVVRIDFTANVTRMWVLPDLTGFDYLNPPAPSAEYIGSAPAFDRIALYSRSPASIDELKVFRVVNAEPASAHPIPTLSPWAIGALTALFLLAGLQFGRRGF